MLTKNREEQRIDGQMLRARTAGMSDEELLLEYRATGQESYFASLVQRYERELYNYLRRFLGDAAMAEDTFQMAFLQVHLKCETFQEGRRFRPWLYTVATNQAIDAQRRNRRHKLVSLDRPQRTEGGDELGGLLELLVGDQQGPKEQAEATERAEWIHRAVARLPEQLRSVVELVYFRGLKYREAAELLSIPVGTVKSRLHTAMARLKDAWSEARPSQIRKTK